MSSRGHAEDVARQTEEVRNILNQFLAQLIPGSEEYTQLASEGQRLVSTAESPLDEQSLVRELGTRLVSQQQARIASGGPATPLEARTQAALGGFREAAKPVSFEQDLLNALSGLPTTTPAGGVFKQPLALAASPVAGPGTPIDDAVFRNALKLVEDRVNAEYAGRGLLGSGLRLEGLGRAGVEASIAEAQRQDALRQEQNRLRQEAYLNATGEFNAGEALRNRQIGVEDALVKMQLGRESDLTGLLSQNINLRLNDLNSFLERTTTREQTLADAARQREATRNAAIGGAVGKGLSTAASFLPGIGPIIGSVGMAATNAAFPTPAAGTPANAGQLYQSQQAQSAQTGQIQPLTRQGGPTGPLGSYSWDDLRRMFGALFGGRN